MQLGAICTLPYIGRCSRGPSWMDRVGIGSPGGMCTRCVQPPLPRYRQLQPSPLGPRWIVWCGDRVMRVMQLCAAPPPTLLAATPKSAWSWVDVVATGTPGGGGGFNGGGCSPFPPTRWPMHPRALLIRPFGDRDAWWEGGVGVSNPPPLPHGGPLHPSPLVCGPTMWRRHAHRAPMQVCAALPLAFGGCSQVPSVLDGPCG